jgi:hypothetical protein
MRTNDAAIDATKSEREEAPYLALSGHSRNDSTSAPSLTRTHALLQQLNAVRTVAETASFFLYLGMSSDGKPCMCSAEEQPLQTLRDCTIRELSQRTNRHFAVSGLCESERNLFKLKNNGSMYILIPIVDQSCMDRAKQVLVDLIRSVDARVQSLWICELSNGNYSIVRAMGDDLAVSLFPISASEEEQLPATGKYQRFDSSSDIASTVCLPEMASVVAHLSER